MKVNKELTSTKKNESLQELSEDVLNKFERMQQEIIEEMIRQGYSREQAEGQARAFS